MSDEADALDGANESAPILKDVAVLLGAVAGAAADDRREYLCNRHDNAEQSEKQQDDRPSENDVDEFSPVSPVDSAAVDYIDSLTVLFYNSDRVSDSPQMPTDGHIDKSSGRRFLGFMRSYRNGTYVHGYQVVSGGNIDPHSTVNQGDDTAIPSGSFSVDTAIKSGKSGFSIQILGTKGIGNRNDIEIHRYGVTTGCIAIQDGWDTFVQDMTNTRDKGIKSIPISVSYQMSDGTNPPSGNQGHHHGDPGHGLGYWPGADGPPTPAYDKPHNKRDR